jgi:hypothetical protein
MGFFSDLLGGIGNTVGRGIGGMIPFKKGGTVGYASGGRVDLRAVPVLMRKGGKAKKGKGRKKYQK